MLKRHSNSQTQAYEIHFNLISSIYIAPHDKISEAEKELEKRCYFLVGY